MTAQQTQTLTIGLMGVVIIVLAYAVAALLMRDGRHPAAPPTSVAQPESAIEPSVAATNRPVTPIEDSPLPPVKPTPPEFVMKPAVVDLDVWSPQQHGCNIEQMGTKMHFWGTVDRDGWTTNKVEGIAQYPVGDFELSADFMVPRFTGSGWALACVVAKTKNGHITIQYQARNNAYLLWRQSPDWKQEFSDPPLRGFGDETRKFHRVLLKYDAATHRATGSVDGRVIGTLTYELKGDFHVELGEMTDKIGNEIDLTFDHTTLFTGGKTIEFGSTSPTGEMP